MDISLFSGSPSGLTVRRTSPAGDYWAFVPHPLPPSIDIDRELATLLSEAAHSLGKLDGLSGLIPNPRLFAPFLRKEAVLSSKIEGTITTLPEVYAFEAEQLNLFQLEQRVSAVDDVREVVNYVRALEFGLERVKEIPISLRLIREMHKVLLDGVRGEKMVPGEFRKYQNAIGSPTDNLQNARFVPPPVPEMTLALNEFEAYIHKKNGLSPLIKLALLHYQFEAIHPFRDGNGRIGRILIPLLLAQWGLLEHPLLYLSLFFEKRRDQYYDSLFDVSASGKWNEWVSFFLTGILEQSKDSIALANKVLQLQRDWRDRLSQKGRSAKLVPLADHLFSRPIITVRQVSEFADVTPKAARSMVEKLENAGILRQIAEALRPQLFSADEIFDLIS
jgi:Fic family protein